MTANVKECAVVVCSEDKVNPTDFSRKWREDELPIVDQYTYLGVETSKRLVLGFTHSNSNRKGEITRRQDGCDPNRLAP